MTHLPNLGHHERLIRVGVGFLLLSIGGFSIGPEWGNLLALIVGFIALATGIVGYCPAWHLLGISTCRRGVGKPHSEHKPADSHGSS